MGHIRAYLLHFWVALYTYSVSQKVAPPQKKNFAIFALLVNLFNWKFSWLFPKHIPIFTPILVHLSEYLYEFYHFYQYDPSNFNNSIQLFYEIHEFFINNKSRAEESKKKKKKKRNSEMWQVTH